MRVNLGLVIQNDRNLLVLIVVPDHVSAEHTKTDRNLGLG